MQNSKRRSKEEPVPFTLHKELRRGGAGKTTVLATKVTLAAFKALKQTLQLIAPLHDIVAYFVSFAKLGNCPACFEFPLSPNPLRGDWGGAEGIGE
ncbi:hypothetical protein P7K49_008439 [Saguinus oedipus]|uniref:Uncharacterized protein n=1 Tax=Saguinus oedipus TaxID=9490 RepID=A0ABQ9W025_SAGOE|nr:hypothetical protein P7K49_008439 [Saguinus oedipus]